MSIAQIKPTTVREIAENVFMIVSDFNPETFDPTVGIDKTKILATTTGGITFTDTPEYVDYGEDLDNCDKNTAELKRKTGSEVKVSGTYATITKEGVKTLIGAATVVGNKIVPDNELKQSHFIEKIWLITDYGNGGFIAIKLKRVLCTSGLSIATTDSGKVQYAFEFVPHKTISDKSDQPYEVYLDDGGSVAGVEISTHSVTIEAESTYILTATTVPESQTVTWSSANTSVATVSNGVITAVAAGNTIITASITVSGVTYTDTCTVVVPAED